MSLASRNLLTSPNSRINTTINTSKTHLRNPRLPLLSYPKPFLNPSRFHAQKPHFLKFATFIPPIQNHTWSIQVKSLDLDGTVGEESRSENPANWDVNFDAFLSILEFFCLVSSIAISGILAVNSGFLGGQRMVFQWLGEKGMVWQCVVLVAGVLVGAVIRRRQWRRICQAKYFSRPVNLVERIEKLEEDFKSSATVIRALSRQLEKLGIRFRVFRKALKEPIAETAALAQKNSEATRALAIQEDILEKELGEIQKVLLAMQEQQQKQLELILAIAKSGKLWDTKREENHGNNTPAASNSVVDGVQQLGKNQIQAVAGQKESNNDNM
ncbi:uncharacterized protein [Coffea arabica]|uniref:Uncharacterized protein n=1 Tax=Coffea arabica TaxID=13443 RepID=A0A6P6TJF4_COFAR|nr:uncharacterized protein LOC113701272 [Coffea arabica]